MNPVKATLEEAMGRSPYPGRGIVIGKSTDGKHAVCAYFIMGRSANSRNRVFVSDGAGIRTQARDPDKLTDPSLVIYAPVRVLNNRTIVTNGDQTDTLYDHLAGGGTFEDALRTRTFEPDGPNWTPRISALVTLLGGGFTYQMSLIKSDGGNPDACLRYFYEYQTPLPGQGRFLHTYADDGNPLPSFSGEPEPVLLPDGLDDTANAIWGALNADNRIALFTRFIRLSDGDAQTRIINKSA